MAVDPAKPLVAVISRLVNQKNPGLMQVSAVLDAAFIPGSPPALGLGLSCVQRHPKPLAPSCAHLCNKVHLKKGQSPEVAQACLLLLLLLRVLLFLLMLQVLQLLKSEWGYIELCPG